MTPSKRAFGLVVVVLVLLAAVTLWHFTHLPHNPLVTTTGNGDDVSIQNVGDFDQFQQDLAARVVKQFGGGADFSVIVATTAYPLGTLLRATGSVPADLEDCVPANPPKPFAAQHLFPSYTMSSNTALVANLGSGALQGLNSAGVNFRQSQNIRYTIADTQIQIMDDKSVEQAAGQGNCGKYIAGHPGMRLIRGTVIGRMSFTVTVDNPATVKAQLAKIGGFSVNDDPGSSTVSIADNESEPIVQLLSEFGAGSSASAANPTPKPVEISPPARSSGPPAPVGISPPVQPPASQPSPPHIFVQMDVSDSPTSGAKVVQILRAEWPTANVESKVQQIPTQKMPNSAQVRYFNQPDLAIANRCLGILRRDYPNAQLVRIGLPSPTGQIEVWLPKVTSAPGTTPVTGL
jgi:hypothetical protein